MHNSFPFYLAFSWAEQLAIQGPAVPTRKTVSIQRDSDEEPLLTNSNEEESTEEAEILRATMKPKQFSIAFQVTKEFPSILENELQEKGVPPTCPTEILEFARTIKKSVDTAQVRISFTSPETNARKTLWIAESANLQQPIESRGFPLETAQHWLPLIESVVTYLGAKELSFRTGHDSNEVDTVSSALESLFAH
ncbi:hypothetical protein [Streptomyces californicus]|uniref:hypothetical protein n=1 Tax=Streptomyces californicus TaxID=67351 RepID=UPI00379881EF